jgi:hypothetical protein
MEAKYLVSESELKELLYLANKCIALENGGVDNWDCYGESIQNHCEIMASEYGHDSLVLDDIVEIEVKQYEKQEVE